jgi:hypothetical protein
VGCTGVTFSNNRIHDNVANGLEFEIGNGAKIIGNAVWENGWGLANDWAWGAGILLSSSANAEVAHNTLAWNASGIAVVSQNRPDQPSVGVVGNSVHDNTVVSTDGMLALAWLADPHATAMFAPAAGNHGAHNSYWFPNSERGEARFAWSDTKAHLEDFNNTPGEQEGRYLSMDERDQALSSIGVLTSPE